jgi:hypothetical protein
MFQLTQLSLDVFRYSSRVKLQLKYLIEIEIKIRLIIETYNLHYSILLKWW